MKLMILGLVCLGLGMGCKEAAKTDEDTGGTDVDTATDTDSGTDSDTDTDVDTDVDEVLDDRLDEVAEEPMPSMPDLRRLVNRGDGAVRAVLVNGRLAWDGSRVQRADGFGDDPGFGTVLRRRDRVWIERSPARVVQQREHDDGLL